MPLAQCPDCGDRVSTSAPGCPHCGRPGPFAAASRDAAAPRPAPPLAPAAPEPLECPNCRLKVANRAVCPRCDERLTAPKYLLPHHFPTVPVEYAGFGPRLGAMLLDALVILPVAALCLFVQTRSPGGAIVGGLLGLVLLNGYEVVGHAVWGQTVGKRVLDIQVRNADGTRIGWEESLVRYSPYLARAVIGCLGLMLAASTLTSMDFAAGGSLFERLGMIAEHEPGWIDLLATLLGWFYLADAIVFFTNRRRRALHDYMAGTVVVHVV